MLPHHTAECIHHAFDKFNVLPWGWRNRARLRMHKREAHGQYAGKFICSYQDVDQDEHRTSSHMSNKTWHAARQSKVKALPTLNSKYPYKTGFNI